MKRIICGFLAVLLAITALCGCSDKGLDAVLACDIPENPQTLDPQQANDPTSTQIVLNLFMGLMRRSLDGSIQCGTAESYSISDDKLTYSFKLREDIFWANNKGFNKQCTAKDFVFGFRRLFSAKTKAPRAKEYFCIKNAENIFNGKIIGENDFGVKALNDFELEITLEKANPRFLELLCEAPAMPCCEEFFNDARGKYGLSDEYTASNGAFYVRKWYYSPYSTADVCHVTLARNSKNAEPFGVCPAVVKFFIEDEEDFINDFITGESHCIAVSNEKKGQITGKFNCEEFSNITVGLSFNENYSLFENSDFRQALALTIPRNSITEILNSFEMADGIIPKNTSLLNKNYREQAGACKISEFNETEAKQLFKKAKPSIDTELLRGARIICKSAESYAAAQYIMQEWQKLGFYCSIEQLSESEFINRYSKGEYEIAVNELVGGYDSPAAYLEQLDGKLAGEELNSLLNVAQQAGATGFDVYRSAEQLLISNAVFIPLFYKNEYFFTNKDISDVVYNPFTKTVDFTYGKMK